MPDDQTGAATNPIPVSVGPVAFPDTTPFNEAKERATGAREVARVLLIEDSEVTSDRVFLGEELLHEGLIHDGDHLRRGRVLIGETAAADDRLADRLEELGADAIPG